MNRKKSCSYLKVLLIGKGYSIIGVTHNKKILTKGKELLTNYSKEQINKGYRFKSNFNSPKVKGFIHKLIIEVVF